MVGGGGQEEEVVKTNYFFAVYPSTLQTAQKETLLLANGEKEESAFRSWEQIATEGK